MPVEDPPTSERVYLTALDAALIGDIIGHPYELPTLAELAYTNSDTDRERIDKRLQALERQGVTMTVEFADGPPKETFPETFYGLTDFGRELFFRRVPEITEQHLKTAYASVEKSDAIKAKERAPRPPTTDTRNESRQTD